MLKKIIIVALAIILLGGSTAAFAWWDTLTVNRLEQNVITIGQGLDLVVADVVIDPIEAGNLIPVSAVLKAGDTYEVVLTYTVNFDATVQEQLDFEVTVSNIEVDAIANPYGLIKVVVDHAAVIENTDVIVTLTVTIDESVLLPEDYEAAYLALANNTITFDVSFAATRQA